MERVRKDSSEVDLPKNRHTASGLHPANSRLAGIASSINNSPVIAAKRQKLQGLFGDAAQLQAEQDPLQPHGDNAQLKEALASKPNNTGLPENLKSGTESLSSISMDNVRVQYNSSKPTQLNALAHVQGTDTHVAPGQEKYLPHEVWPVAQQKQGRVKPTMQMKAEVNVNDDSSEKEAEMIGAKALQMKHNDKDATELTASTMLQSIVLQRRALNSVEREKLADTKKRLASLKESYETHKAIMTNALTKRGGFGDTLGYFQNLGWDDAGEEITKLDTQFIEMADLAQRAISNHKACAEFITKVNFYDKSGGMNRFYNIYKNMERGLLSTERNHSTQFTDMDEVAFQKYLAASKSPVTVYRGAGWGGLDTTTFNGVAFADMVAGGTRDISFKGVVEHTWENNLKNGMVSCTTSIPIALGFATDSHAYGIVWELSLDNYIHVTNLLKKRNWKYRFPGQFEVLYPGSIPKSNIVSMTLYQGNTKLATRTTS